MFWGRQDEELTGPRSARAILGHTQLAGELHRGVLYYGRPSAYHNAWRTVTNTGRKWTQGKTGADPLTFREAISSNLCPRL